MNLKHIAHLAERLDELNLNDDDRGWISLRVSELLDLGGSFDRSLDQASIEVGIRILERERNARNERERDAHNECEKNQAAREAGEPTLRTNTLGRALHAHLTKTIKG